MLFSKRMIISGELTDDDLTETITRMDENVTSRDQWAEVFIEDLTRFLKPDQDQGLVGLFLGLFAQRKHAQEGLPLGLLLDKDREGPLLGSRGSFSSPPLKCGS